MYVLFVLAEARKRGDFEAAKNLCEELNSLSMLRFDPTNPDGVGGEWDVSLHTYRHTYMFRRLLYTYFLVSTTIYVCIHQVCVCIYCMYVCMYVYIYSMGILIKK